MIAASVSSLYLLAALACPVGMGAMMWFMMKGSGHKTRPGVDPGGEHHLSELKAEQERLASRIRALEGKGDSDVSQLLDAPEKTPVT